MTWPIIGHDWAVAQLRRSLAHGREAHAYLFCGPPQIGKTLLAVTLAQALNCSRPDPPCGRCPSCRKIARWVHPDVRLIEAQGAGQTIRIDQVRTLQREASLLPYEGRRRVFILRQFDTATVEAANSLLKTLEEPPSHVVLILTAVDARTLPTTILSRCRRLDLRPVALEVVESALLEQGVPPERARLLARLSGGRVGWAFDAWQQADVLQQREQDLDRLRELLAADRVTRFAFAERAGRDLAACRRQLATWSGWWRDLLLLTVGAGEHLVNLDRLGELRALQERTTPGQVWTVLDALRTTIARLDANVNARLALENLMLKLPRWTPGAEGY